MNICKSCQKNTAVFFVNQAGGGGLYDQSYCLVCAHEKKIKGIDVLMKNMGVGEDNIEIAQERINRISSVLGGSEAFFKVEGGSMEDLVSNLKEKISEIDLEIEEFDAEEVEDGLMLASQDEQASDKSQKQRTKKRVSENKASYIAKYSQNLSQRAKDQLLDPMIGREDELERIVQILNRRKKNNPVLLGGPGVGKTAIAEGLAQRIEEGRVPAKLMDKEVHLLDMTSVVAGTQYRGQFEQRMLKIIKECQRQKNIILVIDELHSIVGTGDTDGSLDAANIIKPALADGSISILGSTTADEYRKHIEKDSALERRFQKVMVEEASPEDTLEILRGVRSQYEEFHHVIYPDEILKSAIRMAGRYINDRLFPDKAIDLLDEAGSNKNMKNISLKDIQLLKDQLQINRELRGHIAERIEESQDQDSSLELYREDSMLRTEQLRLIKNLKEETEKAKASTITEDDLAKVVEMWTGIPVQSITETESTKLLKLEELLEARVLGQKEAISALARGIRRKRAGFRAKGKPLSFFFVGPTGVGKTELAKALSITLFQSESALIRLDMSEYMEKHSVSKLIGSPPGYLGYDDSGHFAEKIRRKPYSVILLDEIEKAHADVNNVLLQVLDDGRLTDSQGRVIDFSNTIVIMTSNAGTSLKEHAIGFNHSNKKSLDSRVDQAMKDLFRPEFLNRIDEIIVFNELEEESLIQIVDLMLAEIAQELKEHELKLVASETAKKALVKKGYNLKMGARPLRRAIQAVVEDNLSEKIISGELDDKLAVSIDYQEGDFVFESL